MLFEWPLSTKSGHLETVHRNIFVGELKQSEVLCYAKRSGEAFQAARLSEIAFIAVIDAWLKLA